MYPMSFSYHRASSLANARQLLGQHPGAKLLAGGHSLIPLLKLRLATPDTIVDIGRVAELRGATITGAVLRVGALATHAEIAASEAVRRGCPALAEAAGMVGDAQVRNRGTIGGNIAHADPASDLPTVLTANDATMVISGDKGERRVPAGGFFNGVMVTALEDGDILAAVEIPVIPAGAGSTYVKFSHPASRYAVIGVAATIVASGGKCQSARVAIGGLVPASVRLPSVESALAGQSLSADAIKSAAGRTAADLGSELLGDLFASADHRKAMAPVYVERALSAAAARAK